MAVTAVQEDGVDAWRRPAVDDHTASDLPILSILAIQCVLFEALGHGKLTTTNQRIRTENDPFAGKGVSDPRGLFSGRGVHVFTSLPS